MAKKHKKTDLLPLIKARRSAYNFSKRAVQRAEMLRILEAGRWAPSALNLQPWRFICIDEPKKIDQLMKICYYGFFHAEPTAIIAVVLDGRHLCKSMNDKFKHNLIGIDDANISIGGAVMNMALQAQARGVDSCILTPKVEKAVKLLNLRKYESVSIMLGLGYESKPALRRRRRKPLKDITEYVK